MKNFLKVLIRSIVGCMSGITILMIAYLMVYYIGGQELFVSTISKLSDATLFQNQLLAVSIAGILISNLLCLFNKIYDKKDINPYSSIFKSIFVIGLVFVVFSILILHSHLFDKAIGSCLIIIYAILYSTSTVIYCAHKEIEQYLINKKLKEKNG